MKTILEVTGRMNRGGAETMLLDIIKQTHEDFNYVFLINAKSEAERHGEYDEILKSLGCSFYYIGTVWNMGIPTYIKMFKEICSEINSEIAPIDVVHCHMNSKCGTVLLAAKQAGIKRRIAHSHAEIKFNGKLPIVMANYAELNFQKILINIYATDYWGCSKKALPSLYTKKHIKSEKCQIIKNAIDVQRFTRVKEENIKDYCKLLRIPENKKIIGTVGRMARVKNTKFIVEVFAEVYKRNSDTCLIIVGGNQDKTYSEEIQQAVKEHKLNNAVIFTGVQSNLELIYPIFDVFIGASLREGLGLVAVEAQACGTSCVLSEGFPQEVDIGVDLVQFVEGFNVGSWIQCIEEAFNREIPLKIDKKLIEKRLVECGYDAKVEAQKVKNQYLK